MKTTGEKRADRRALIICGIVFLLLVATMLSGIMTGAVAFDFHAVLTALSGGKNSFIIMQYRLPRIGVSILAGAALGLAGVFLQGALRNPLASPDVIGITKWAGLGAFLCLLLLPPAWSWWSVPLGVTAGALLGALFLLLIGRMLGGSISALALSGVALGMLAHALMQYIMVLFPSRADQSMIWLAGSVYGSTWADVGFLAVWLLVSLPFVLLASRSLDAGAFGDDTLASIGLLPGRLRGGLILIAVILSAGSVAVVGSMGFLGLLAPHMARILVGPRSRHLVPASGLLGALALSLADLAGRVVALPNEIPAGIVAAIIGGPYLVFLLIKETRRHG